MPPLTPNADLIKEVSFCNYRGGDHRDSQLFKVYRISWTEGVQAQIIYLQCYSYTHSLQKIT